MYLNYEAASCKASVVKTPTCLLISGALLVSNCSNTTESHTLQAQVHLSSGLREALSATENHSVTYGTT